MFIRKWIIKKLIHNYHTHTKFCFHADSTIEENILAAIKNGYETIGFSEHVLYLDVKRTHRLRTKNDLEEYLSTIKSMKEKYKDKIKILSGLECEWIPKYYDWYLELKNRSDVDFLILGHHGDFLDERFVFMDFNNAKLMKRYVEGLLDAMDSKLYDYVAHPDAIFRTNNNIDIENIKLMEPIIQKSKNLNIPLGFNGNGYYSFYMKTNVHHYPNPLFWKMVSKIGAPTIIELDAHNTKLFDREFGDKLLEFAQSFKLNIIDKLDNI